MKKEVRGFTLLEVVISLLIMGFATTAILQLWQWGTYNYRAIDDDSREQHAWLVLRREIRRLVTTGGSEQLSKESLEKILPQDGILHIADFSLNKYAQEACFLRLILFADRNRNNKPEPRELLPTLTLCFRKRSQT